MIDVNLGGVWKTVKAGVPHLLAGGRGGSIILTSSVGGLKAYPHTGHYIAAKHGVVGLMRTFAVELGAQNIRVNSVHPTHVNTPLFMNERHYRSCSGPTWRTRAPTTSTVGRTDDAHAADRRGSSPRTSANAVLFLASDEARYVTGVTLPDRRRQLPEVTTAAELSIPQGWDAITPGWMTTALAIHHAGAVVDTVRVALRDDGTNRRARLELTYSAGSGPATVFAKAVDPAHAELVALTSGLYHEPRLFSSGVALPLDHPTVYTALIDEEHSDFLMIMEDVVARGADPRDSTRPMTVDQVANGVRGLARMHSAYWGERLTGDPALGWVEPFVAFEGIQYAPLHIAHERLGDTVAAEILALSGEQLFVDIWARYIGNADDVAADAAAR